jgi:tetratricopeptide (TPR) repeat protein
LKSSNGLWRVVTGKTVERREYICLIGNQQLTTLKATECGRDITNTIEVASPSCDTVFKVSIALITLAVFLPVLQNGFVDWDDKILVHNVTHQGLGWSQLQWMFAGFHFGQYQPLAWMTIGLDYFIWWADPFGHHLTNLALHVVNAVLLYCIGLELFLHWSSDNRSPAIWFRVAAGIAALGFAIHPLRAEPVAWASARGELTASVFFLLGLFGYLKANAPVSVRTNPARWTIFSACAYLLSLLAGPTGLVLPIIFLVIDSYPLRRSAGQWTGLRSGAVWVLRQKAPFLLLGVTFVVLNIVGRHYKSIAQSAYQDDFFTWTLYLLAAPAFYLWKAILPIGLSPTYELTGWSIAVYAAVGVLICVGFVCVRDRWPALLSAWLCYLALLLPIFRSEYPAEQMLADRYTYLASLPWALLVGVAIKDFFHSGPDRRLGIQSLLWGGGLIVIVFNLLGVLSWSQAGAWRDSDTLWRHAVKANPTSQAHFNLATLAETQGRYDDAIASNKRAVAIDPQRWEAHERTARLLQKQGKIAEAVEHYRVVVRLNPQAIDARENLAAGLVYQGEVGEAVQHFREVVKLAPQRNEARVKLGTILAVQDRLGEAAETFTAAAKADPADGRIRLQLGQVLAAQGKLKEAVHQFAEAARLRPEDAEAHESLGRGLSELGIRDEAAAHLREALRILRSQPVAR